MVFCGGLSILDGQLSLLAIDDDFFCLNPFPFLNDQLGSAGAAANGLYML